MQMSLGPQGRACGGPYMSQHGKTITSICSFSPSLTSLACSKTKQNKTKNHKRAGQNNCLDHQKQQKTECTKTSRAAGQGEDFRQLVSSMDGLRCGWSCEVSYCNACFTVWGRVSFVTFIPCIYTHLFQILKSLFWSLSDCYIYMVIKLN